MMQNHILNMELNRHYYRFVELKVTEKKIRFSGGLTEYFPPNPQLVNNLRYASFQVLSEHFLSSKFYLGT